MAQAPQVGLGTQRQRRTSERRPLALQGRLLWKDDSGAMRFTPVVTRNVSDHGVFVECESPTSIPLYRLVHLQIDRVSSGADTVPQALRLGRVLSAVYRLGRYRSSSGTPEGYALRLLIEPAASAHSLPDARSIA